jgi:hypothetical protein
VKTLTIIVPKPMQQGQAHYRVPLKVGTGPVPSLLLQVGKENEVQVADQAHEDLLRADRNLKVLDEEGQHDKPAVDELKVAFAKLPPEMKAQLERGLRQAEGDMRAELEEALDRQAAAIAETKKQLDAAIAQQATIAKENADLQLALKTANEEIAKLKAPPAVPPVVDEKSGKKGK